MSLEKQLFSQARKGDVDGCRTLLALGTNVNFSCDNGGTALHAASIGGMAEVCELLITHGAQVNAKDHGGWTALHWSVYDGFVDNLKLLLSHGAEVDAVDVYGNTPLMTALGAGYTEVCLQLLNGGADLELIKPWLTNDSASIVHPECMATVVAWVAKQAAHDAVDKLPIGLKP